MNKRTHNRKSKQAVQNEAVILAEQHIASRYDNRVRSDAPLIAYVGEGEHDMQRALKVR